MFFSPAPPQLQPRLAECVQTDPQFGADIGGVTPVFFPFDAEAEFDSWLTIGPTDGSAGDALGASPGLGLGDWSPSAAFSTNNGAVFWMDPTNGPSGGDPIVLAQITNVEGSGTASAMMQGRNADGSADWTQDVSWSW